MNKVTQQSSVSKTNYNGIDIARLICAILVMMIHVPPLGNLGGIGVFKYLNYGIEGYATRIAVPFFSFVPDFSFIEKQH